MTARTLRLSVPEQGHLITGAAALGTSLDATAVAQLARFADLLDLWSPKVNLLSCGSARELIDRHLLDSLAVGPLLPSSGSIVDLGTGAGFPGVPLAVVRADQRFVLVEVRRRRATFLREVRRTLQLTNVEVLEQRAETPPMERQGAAEAVVTRAVWSDDSLLGICSRWLSPTGRIFWMRSDPLAEAPTLAGIERDHRFQYQIGTHRLRTIEVLRPTPTPG
jgi:16S rRNA (guanine527-N7)-methyltransferase